MTKKSRSLTSPWLIRAALLAGVVGGAKAAGAQEVRVRDLTVAENDVPVRLAKWAPSPPAC